MEIIIQSQKPLGYSLDVLQDRLEAILVDDEKVTGGGIGIDGWRLYVEVSRELTAADKDRFAGFLGSMKVPTGTCIQWTAQDGSKNRLSIKADWDRDAP